MTAHINEAVLERVTNLDLLLFQRFPARDINRLARLLARTRRHGPAESTVSASQESDARLFCIGGLETKIVSGSTVQVSPGQHLAYVTSPVTETRPGTYSPAPVEPDDDHFAIADLPVATNVAPSTVISGSTGADELWIVYGTMSLDTVESDSARVVFNETTGVFDSISAEKVKRWTITPAVARVVGSAVLGTVAATLPSNCAVLAVLFVPVGSTDLSTALVFDCRTLPDEDSGPNMVGGHGRIGYLDPAPSVSSINSMVAPDSSTATFFGQFWARYQNELLHVTCGPDGLSALDIKSPSASWDSAASPTAPKVAWLYLARVTTFTPRPVARGTSPLGGDTSDRTYMRGCLVLSSVPPKIGAKTASASSNNGGFFDLRPSSSITLPNVTAGNITFPWGGAQTSNALCLGPVIYTAFDTPNNCPVIAGPGFVTPDGWISWPLEPSPTLDLAFRHKAECLFDTLSTTITSGADLVTITAAPKVISSKPIPFTAVRFSLYAFSNAGGYQSALELSPNIGRFHPISTIASGQAIWATIDVEITPQQTECGAQLVAAGSGSINTASGNIDAVRWPFNEPLVT